MTPLCIVSKTPTNESAGSSQIWESGLNSESHSKTIKQNVKGKDNYKKWPKYHFDVFYHSNSRNKANMSDMRYVWRLLAKFTYTKFTFINFQVFIKIFSEYKLLIIWFKLIFVNIDSKINFC